MREDATHPLIDSEVHAFRDEVRRVAETLASGRDPEAYFNDRSASADVYRELGARGWLSLGWPHDFGGSALGPIYEYVMWDELAYTRLARFDLAAGIVAKSLIAEGTAEQQEQLLPGIRLGGTRFALGYSEPEAGSDLGSLRTTARRDGDVYVVNGEKRWTSDAHHAQYLWLLARTGAQEERSRGLTLFVCDLSLDGIDVRPIPTLGGHRLNEVFLTDVPVPASMRVGGEGEAWRIMQGALARERHLQFFPGRLWRDLEEVASWLGRAGAPDDAVVRDRLAQLAAEVAALEAHSLAIVHAATHGDDAAIAAARSKILGGQLAQRIARLPFELGEPAAVLSGSVPEFLWRQSISETVGGGTHEIMVRVVAQRELLLGAGK